VTTTVLGRGSLGELVERVQQLHPSGRLAVVTDHAVWRALGAQVGPTLPANAVVAPIAVGEAHKTRESWAMVTDALLAAGCDRSTIVIGIGGGVVTDLAGFVAATFMRGVPWVAVPTTLLAMVDAAHGGKTGVDTPAGKNLVGAFHPPTLVVVDPDSLRTLPAERWRDGLAEVLKHGVIADADYFERTTAMLPALLAADGPLHDGVPALIAESIRIKQQVVADDPREDGRRRILNFGHTIAHAIERVSDYAISHGQAVAIGMCVESRIGAALGITPASVVQAVEEGCARAGFARTVPATLRHEDIVAATLSDKKAVSGSARYALPEAVGTMHRADGAWAVGAPDAVVRAALS
jgi:3-dehydroquinate synthase